MKDLNLFDKIVFFLNCLVAVALLLGYLLPYIPPTTFPILAVLSLSVPVLILINFIFFIYWLLRMKRQMLLSFLVLLIGISHVFSLYKFTDSEEKDEENALKLMSYNVKQFNVYNWKEDADIPQDIRNFVDEVDPNFLLFQEYYKQEAEVEKLFEHQYIKSKKEGQKFAMAIFSDYPIINTGSLDFPQEGNNNAIFADVLVGEDTLRLMNVHLQSFRVEANVEALQKQDSKTLLKRMASAFVKQEVQAKMIVEQIEKTPYKMIIAGDFNNTAFSYVFHKIKGEKFVDAFKEAGSGFGQTFSNDLFPLRIDYILVDEEIQIDAFKRFEVDHSDHFPVLVTFKLEE